MLYHTVSDTEKLGQIPMVWIFFLSTNRNYLQRNQLSASTLGPGTHQIILSISSQIESSGTFLTSHFSKMRYHIVSDTENFGQIRWSGFFSYQQTGTASLRNQL